VSVSAVLTLVAVVLFVLAAFGVSPFAGVALVPLGLAFFAAAHLPV
jgi:uncharacterized membrane protein